MHVHVSGMALAECYSMKNFYLGNPVSLLASLGLGTKLVT